MKRKPKSRLDWLYQGVIVKVIGGVLLVPTLWVVGQIFANGSRVATTKDPIAVAPTQRPESESGEASFVIPQSEETEKLAGKDSNKPSKKPASAGKQVIVTQTGDGVVGYVQGDNIRIEGFSQPPNQEPVQTETDQRLVISDKQVHVTNRVDQRYEAEEQPNLSVPSTANNARSTIPASAAPKKTVDLPRKPNAIERLFETSDHSLSDYIHFFESPAFTRQGKSVQQGWHGLKLSDVSNGLYCAIGQQLSGGKIHYGHIVSFDVPESEGGKPGNDFIFEYWRNELSVIVPEAEAEHFRFPRNIFQRGCISILIDAAEQRITMWQDELLIGSILLKDRAANLATKIRSGVVADGDLESMQGEPPIDRDIPFVFCKANPKPKFKHFRVLTWLQDVWINYSEQGRYGSHLSLDAK